MHGQIRAKLCNNTTSDKMTTTSFAGLFVNDPFDKVIEGLVPGDDDVNIVAMPDETSKRPSPWNNNEEFVFCNAVIDKGSCFIPSIVCPRTMLVNICKAYEQIGIKVKCGLEIEWTILQEKTSNPLFTDCASYVLHPMLDARLDEYKNRLFDSCERLSIPIETFHVENGRSMLEMSFAPSDPVTVADNAQLFKMVAKKEANQFGWNALFTSKPFCDAAGSGRHVHISLERPCDGHNISETTCGPFLAGILRHMRDLSCMYLPTVDSYERIGSSHFWTASHVSFAIDKRAFAVRIINHGKSNQRIEVRLPGADSNPYLALVAILKSGLDGILQDLQLVTSAGELGEPLPTSLGEAIALLRSSADAQRILGSSFIDHYTALLHYEVGGEHHDRPSNWKSLVY